MSTATAEFESLDIFDRDTLAQWGTAFSTWEDRGEEFCAELRALAERWRAVDAAVATQAAFDHEARSRPEAMRLVWAALRGGPVRVDALRPFVSRALQSLGWSAECGRLYPAST